jgi:hypothetical protein
MNFIARGKPFVRLPESEGLPCHEPAARGLVVGFVPHPLFQQVAQELRQAFALLGGLDAGPADNSP